MNCYDETPATQPARPLVPASDVPRAWLLPRLRALIEDAVFRADAACSADDPAERAGFIRAAVALSKTLREAEAV